MFDVILTALEFVREILFSPVAEGFRADPVTAIVGLGSAAIGANATKSAASKQAKSAKDANALQLQMYEQTREDQAPWRAAGQESLNKLMALLNDGSLTSKFAGNVELEPGYQFGMKEGMKAIDNSASARGGIGGAALKAGTRYAQDYAGTKYGQAFDRWRAEQGDIYNRLAGIAGIGQQANAIGATAGSNYANQVGANMMDAANAQAASRVAQGNIYGNLLNQGAAWGNANNWWRAPASFGPQLDPFFTGTGGSGD